MKSTFSQRIGIEPIERSLQINDIDQSLRNAIWSCLYTEVVDSWSQPFAFKPEFSTAAGFLRIMWVDFFKKPSDEMPIYLREATTMLKTFIFKGPWHKVYDFLEFTLGYLEVAEDKGASDLLASHFNDALQKELSGYRFVGSQLVPITNESEIEELRTSITITSVNKRLLACNVHLVKSLKLLFDRQNPDYSNAIKEAISAVESLAKIITNDNSSTLGVAIVNLSNIVPIHRALIDGIKKIYGYSSDEDGIRHGSTGENRIEFEEAKFIVMFCSSLVNYLIFKADKAGVSFD